MSNCKRSTSKPGIGSGVRLLPWVAMLCCCGKVRAGEPAGGNPPTLMIASVTFATDRGKLYAPLLEVAQFFGWSVLAVDKQQTLTLNGVAVPWEDYRRLLDGTELVSTAGLAKASAQVALHPSGQTATILSGARQFTLTRAAKRVEISLTGQELRAWQGDRLVLQTKVSTGRNGRTPPGRFTAGPYKARMHYSTRYHHAPMPWSVQVNGPVFIHGFTSVPDYPASHGCIRLPLTGGNPARFFYEWVDVGTPVDILPVTKIKPVDNKTKISYAPLSALHHLGFVGFPDDVADGPPGPSGRGSGRSRTAAFIRRP